MTNLCDIQAAVRDINPYYVGMLTWKQQGNKRLGILITAVPKKPLSELAFNSVKRVFKRFGGKFVSWRGQSWFELVLKETSPRATKTSLQGNVEPFSSGTQGPVLTQIEAKKASLCRAGQQFLEET
jgi:hypothetical protein